jgi:hypothetical protein
MLYGLMGMEMEGVGHVAKVLVHHGTELMKLEQDYQVCLGRRQIMHKADWSRPSTDGQFVGGMIHML